MRGNLPWLLAGLCAGLLTVAALYVSIVIWPLEITDVLTYRHGARLIGAGGVGLYDTELLPEGVWPYLYPPAFAALVAPLLLLPEGLGNVLGGLLVAGSVTTSFWGLSRLTSLSVGRTIVLALALAPATVWLLIMGQVDALVVTLLTLALLAFERGRVRTAGALIGLATVIKVIPVLALLLFLIRRRWRVVGAATVSIGVFSLLPLPWLVAEAGLAAGIGRLVGLHLEFVTEVALMGVGHPAAEPWLRLPWNASLPATSLRLAGTATPGSLIMWVLVLGSAWLSRATRDMATGVALIVSSAALGSFVFSTHNVFLLALPLALAFTFFAAGLTLAGIALTYALSPALGTMAYLAVWVTCAWKAWSLLVRRQQPPGRPPTRQVMADRATADGAARNDEMIRPL